MCIVNSAPNCSSSVKSAPETGADATFAYEHVIGRVKRDPTLTLEESSAFRRSVCIAVLARRLDRIY